MIREWHHLQLLKQGGRAHAPTGVSGTSPGELAVLCPACPHPNINLPMNWASVDKESEYVFMFTSILHISTTVANPSIDISTTSPLGLMRAFASNDAKSPVTRRTQNSAPASHMLLRGSRTVGILINTSIKMMYVCLICSGVDLTFIQISTCSGLSAVEHANTKFSKGYATTGVVCTTCSHEFVLPEGAGQLQKGERFVSLSLLRFLPS